MAYSAKLNDYQLNEVKNQLSELIPDLIRGGFGNETLQLENIEMGEAFALYVLGYDDIDQKKPIYESAIHTGCFLNQLFVNECASFCAISGPGEENKWNLQSVMSSSLSSQIDTGMNWVDLNWRQQNEVTILKVPAFHIHFLWLQDGSQSRYYFIQQEKEDQIFSAQREFSDLELLQILSVFGEPRGRI